jgi:hypothetical protein
LLLGAFLGRGVAGAGEVKPPRQWALLVAVQNHNDASMNLRYTTNDVLALRRILTERAGLPADQVLLLSDRDHTGKEVKARLPTLANLRRELPRILARAGAGDRVMVHFSGHGVLHNGQTYLVPRDFDPRNPARTGLPIGELRKALASCNAKVKFLTLDCCHAGNDRRAADRTLAAERVARALAIKGVSGGLVLASCRDDESSLEWRDRRMGLFSYWLCRALEGAATSGDGQVTFDAVNRYVHERVSSTAEKVFALEQNPVRFGKAEGTPVVLALRPEAPESLCRRLAEHLDLEVRHRRLKKVGVLEFLQPLGKAEGLSRADLPAYCAERVRLALAALAGKAYQVVDAEAMRGAVRGLRVEQVGTPQAMRVLGKGAGGLDGVVLGTIRRRGAAWQVQCDLVATKDGSSLVTPSGMLPLSEDLLGASGLSFDNRDRPSGAPHAPKVCQHAEEQAQEAHPLLDPKFPFRLELYAVEVKPGQTITKATPRRRKELVQAAFTDPATGKRRVDMVVPARKGEVYEIRVESRAKHRVAMTLLVDGINTVGQKRERLGNARSWVLDPEDKLVVDGWHLPDPGGKKGFVVKRFQFVDAARSVAGRQQFTEALGVITAAFYAEAGRSLGTGEGPEEERSLQAVRFRAGRLLGVVHVRYADERDLKK